MRRLTLEDSYMDITMFAQLKKEIREGEFMTYRAGNKSFDVMPLPTYLREHIYNKIEARGYKVQNVLSFIRTSTATTDTAWNIHSDLNVLGNKPTHGAVLYVSEPPPNIGLTGTAFWDHHLYGYELPNHISDEKYDEMVEKHSNTVSLKEKEWVLNTVIGHKANRLIVYPANHFHSKYPNKAWGDTFQEGRIVVVFFFNMMKL